MRPADLVYGRDFDEESIPLENVTGEMGEVVIRGQVMEIDEREIRGEKTILFLRHRLYGQYHGQIVYEK